MKERHTARRLQARKRLLQFEFFVDRGLYKFLYEALAPRIAASIA